MTRLLKWAVPVVWAIAGYVWVLRGNPPAGFLCLALALVIVSNTFTVDAHKETIRQLRREPDGEVKFGVVSNIDGEWALVVGYGSVQWQTEFEYPTKVAALAALDQQRAALADSFKRHGIVIAESEPIIVEDPDG